MLYKSVYLSRSYWIIYFEWWPFGFTQCTTGTISTDHTSISMGNFPDYNLDWKEMLPTSYILTLYHGHYMEWDAHRDWEEESNMVRQSAVVVQGVVFSALRDDIWYLEMQTTLVRHLAAGWERSRSSGPITWGRTRYTWLLATELLTTDQLSRCTALTAESTAHCI